MTDQHLKDPRVSIGSFIALAFAIAFFSGLLQSGEWYGVFDFTTLNGAFGHVITGVENVADGVIASSSTFRGAGGSGARDGFIFAFTLIPTVMFALAMIQVLEHYGALDAARKLLSPLLKPLLGVPGESGLALIASLQSVDAGASMTKELMDSGKLTEKEADVFTMFQFSAGATIVNFFSSGAVLFTLAYADGTTAVTTSIGLCVAVMLVLKVFGANMMRLYLSLAEKKADNNNVQTRAQGVA